MKIAKYNVWYPKIEVRAEQLIETINSIDADIIGLQEVPPAFYEKLTTIAKYPYRAYAPYKDKYVDDEGLGLAILSKYPINGHFSLAESADHDNSIAHNAIIEAKGIRISVTNVHLPWDSALAKEKQIVAIDKYIHVQKDDAHFFVLLGDFNTTMEASVHRYLLGDQTLLGCESNPYWNDLACAHAALNGYEAAPTLDFVNNPRWGGKNTNYVPDVCDRIYIMESFNWDNEFKLRDVAVFGKEVSPATGYAPSDHYGVLGEVDFFV